MNNIEQIFYCNVGNCGWTTHKEYPVVERKNWKYIVVDGKQIGISSLPQKMKIKNFDDFVFAYVFGGLFKSSPCIAMDYYVYQKMTNKRLSVKEYLEFIKKRA